jgi:TRAP transporter TAXI family solute receptor
MVNKNNPPRALLWLVVAVTTILMPFAVIAADGVGMVTGLKDGTYYQFGLDMAKFAQQEGLTLVIKESAGSLANIERINSKENAAFGIVQADVLTFLNRDPQLQDITRRLRVIFPFYLEEVHVLARNNISTLRDLAGKRVSIGVDGSGVWLTAKNIFHLLGIHVAREEHFDTDEAIQRVLTGELDAMFYVAGKPTDAFEPLAKMAASGQQEIIQLLDQVHFVPITEPEIFAETYEQDGVYLGPDEYPWMKEKVPTAAVRAVLVSFDFSSRRNDYYRLRCTQLGKLGQAIRANLRELQNGGGHPKWKEVDLERTVPRWQRDKCSLDQTSFDGDELQRQLKEKFFNK